MCRQHYSQCSQKSARKAAFRLGGQRSHVEVYVEVEEKRKKNKAMRSAQLSSDWGHDVPFELLMCFALAGVPLPIQSD